MLAIRLIICRGGVFVIEQPATSVVFRHPRFNELLKLVTETWLLDMSTYVCLNREKLRLQKPLLFKHWIPLKVYKQSFWMQGWGGKTPKRTTLWSNSSAIRLFKTGSEHSKTSKLMKGKGLTDRYKDRSGRWRFKGNSRLKGSQQNYTLQWLLFLYSADPVLVSCLTCAIILRTYPVGFGVRFAKAMKYFQKERATMKTESNIVVHWRQYMLNFSCLIALWWGVLISQSDPFTSRISCPRFPSLKIYLRKMWEYARVWTTYGKMPKCPL